MTTDNIQPLIYKSTRGQAKELYFKDVIFEGLASDGGLYIPSVWPKLDNDLITEFKNHVLSRYSLPYIQALHRQINI